MYNCCFPPDSNASGILPTVTCGIPNPRSLARETDLFSDWAVPQAPGPCVHDLAALVLAQASALIPVVEEADEAADPVVTAGVACDCGGDDDGSASMNWYSKTNCLRPFRA